MGPGWRSRSDASCVCCVLCAAVMCALQEFFEILLVYMRGDQTEIAAQTFELIDESMDGEVNKFELMRYLGSTEQESWRKRCINELMNELLGMVDTDHSGEPPGS